MYIRKKRRPDVAGAVKGNIFLLVVAVTNVGCLRDIFYDFGSTSMGQNLTILRFRGAEVPWVG